jgi:hypothetical protein
MLRRLTAQQEGPKRTVDILQPARQSISTRRWPTEVRARALKHYDAMADNMSGLINFRILGA